MKFTEGFWRLREGVQANYANAIYEVEKSQDTLSLFAPVKPITGRGATLNCPVLSVHLSSPLPGVIRVRVTHFEGVPESSPNFKLADAGPAGHIDEETVTGFVQGMRDRDGPLHVFHFDCFWMKAFHWIDLEWDPDVFPDPEGMLQRLKSSGLKVCLWINPYVAQRSALFAEAVEKGYLVMKPDGSVYQKNRWQAGMALIDFTNPAACRWYQDLLGRLVDMGVDSFKTDFGEEIPTDCVYYDGSDPVKRHNYYMYLYNRTVFEVLVEYFLPDGIWTDFMTGEEKEGGRWFRERYDYLGLPLLARENTVIPVGATADTPEYELAADVTFHAFRIADGASLQVVVPRGDGRPATVLDIAGNGGEIRFSPASAGGAWRVLLRGIRDCTEISGASLTKDKLGVLITPDSPNATVAVVLR